MAEIYEDDRPFIFVSYSHADDEFALRVIDELDSAGYRVWYDKGIPLSHEWAGTITAHVETCSFLLALVSRAFARSQDCSNEVGMASRFKKSILVAFIEDFDLDDLLSVNRTMYYHVNQKQAILRNDFESDEAFVESIANVAALEPCMREEVRARNNAIKVAIDVLSRSASDVDALRNVLNTLQGLDSSVQNDEVRQIIGQVENRLRELEVQREKRRQQEAREKAIGVARVVLEESRDDVLALRHALSGLRGLPDAVRDEGVERYASQLEGRLRELEIERALLEQMERDRSDAMKTANTALHSHGDDDDALWNALHKLNRIPNFERYPDAKDLASKISDRLADLEKERKRRVEEVRAYSDAVYAARSALRASQASEGDLQDALSALGNLPDSVIDQTTDTYSRLIDKRLRQLREEARAKAVDAAARVLKSSEPDKQGLENSLAELRGLHDIDGDPEVRRLITETEERLGRMAADEVQAAKSTSEVIRKNLSEYSWAELKTIADMIAAARTDSEGLKIAKAHGLVDSEGKLRGDTKPVALTNGRQSSIRIAGFRHDDRADSKGKAGITFEFAGVPDAHAMNPIPTGFLNSIFGAATNSGGWRDSKMRAYLNGGFRGLLPRELSSHIVQVRKRTNNRGGLVHNDASVVTVTEDELWLLSMSEVYGRLSGQSNNVPKYPAVYDAEGLQYQFYADQGVSTTSYGFCKKSGADSDWWLRSPYATSSDDFRCVGSDGGWFHWYVASNGGGVSPGFCF